MKPRNIDRLVHCFVLGDKTIADPYTVVLLKRQTAGTVLSRDQGLRYFWVGLGMGPSPFHPQGFGQHICWNTRPYQRAPRVGGRNYLGRRIKFADLPPDCQKLALRSFAGGKP